MLNKKGYTRYNKKSVCCSGYYIKVAQISCPPPPTTPVVEGVQTAGSQLPPVRGSPRRFCWQYFSTQIVCICLSLLPIFVLKKYTLCVTSVLPLASNKVMTSDFADCCAHRSLSFDTRSASNTVSRWKTVESESREFLPCVLIRSPHTWAIKAQYLCYQTSESGPQHLLMYQKLQRFV